MSVVANFIAKLGLQVNQQSFARGSNALQKLAGMTVKSQRSFTQMANGSIKVVESDILSVAKGAERALPVMGALSTSFLRAASAAVAFISVRAGSKYLVGFNSTMEDTRNQIAGMLALVKQTAVGDQFENADKLLANLQRRATELPGTTLEYARTLGMITQPIMDAGLGLQDLEDLTVNTVVAAKALGVRWDVAARDVDQAVRGTFRSVDVLTGKLLGAQGFKGQEGRQRFNAMSAKDRAEALKNALMQKQITELAAIQGKSFSGVMSTLVDRIQQFFGLVGKGLFESIGDQIKSWNQWFRDNDESVKRFATTVSEGLAAAFEVVSIAAGLAATGIVFITNNGWLLYPVIGALTTVFIAFGVAAAGAWIAAAAPILAVVAVLTAVYVVVLDIAKGFLYGKGVAIQVWRFIADEIDRTWSRLQNMAAAVRDFFISMGQSVSSAWQEIWAWVDSKIATLKGWYHQAVSILGTASNYVFGTGTGEGPISSVVTQNPAVPAPAAGIRSSAPPVVRVLAPMNVKIQSTANEEQVKAVVKGAIDEHHQKVWVEVNNAIGEDEPEDSGYDPNDRESGVSG